MQKWAVSSYQPVGGSQKQNTSESIAIIYIFVSNYRLEPFFLDCCCSMGEKVERFTELMAKCTKIYILEEEFQKMYGCICSFIVAKMCVFFFCFIALDYFVGWFVSFGGSNCLVLYTATLKSHDLIAWEFLISFRKKAKKNILFWYGFALKCLVAVVCNIASARNRTFVFEYLKND